MKVKRIALAAIMMLAVLSANAQYEPGKWAIQIKFGFGAAQLTNMEKIPLSNSTLDNKLIGAKTLGLDVEYQVSKMLGLSIGLSHNWQGSGWEDYSDNGVKYKEPQIDLEYLCLPVIANFYVCKGLALKTGIQVGYLTDADISVRQESSLDGRDLTVTSSLDMKKDCKDIDLSIPVGISYEFRSHFVLDARYNIGLTKVNKESIDGVKDSKNGVFMLTFGYKFDL